MEVETHFIPYMTIEEFAEKNNLLMVITERSLGMDDPLRFYAHFKKCEVKGYGVLISTYGNGATPDAAVEHYARKIELTTLVCNAFSSKNRKEIQVPRLKIRGM